jgi:hypothetical protein
MMGLPASLALPFSGGPPSGPFLLMVPDDELLEPQRVLLSGDANDGSDFLKLSGDES